MFALLITPHTKQVSICRSITAIFVSQDFYAMVLATSRFLLGFFSQILLHKHIIVGLHSTLEINFSVKLKETQNVYLYMYIIIRHYTACILVSHIKVSFYQKTSHRNSMKMRIT